jgi:glycosyltransferase involved in cell wall biosynthesis
MLNTMDRSGGAARAAARLHRGLRNLDVDSRMLVQVRTSEDNTVTGGSGKTAGASARMRLLLDQLPVMAHLHKQPGVFAPALLPGTAWRRANRLHADIIHLHWITKAFVAISDIPRFNAPLVWTLHDMWPFTGGCHYDMGCGRYTSGCGTCPLLGSRRSDDLSARLLRRKRRALEAANLTIVSPSTWLADCARGSELLHDVRIEVIPNGIDLERFRPVPKPEARAALSIRPDKKVILFGAMGPTDDRRKGYDYLQAALQTLARNGCTAELVIFGVQQSSRPPCSLPTRYTGKLDNDHDLVRLYSAADVFVAPSAQDNLPNTIMEALACSTPCVAFRVGGIPDMIRHRQNGYLANPGDSNDLAAGIEWVLGDAQRRTELSDNACAMAVENYDLRTVAGRYKDLYVDILETAGGLGPPAGGA